MKLKLNLFYFAYDFSFFHQILGRFQPTEAPRPTPVPCASHEATCKDGTCISKVRILEKLNLLNSPI